MTYEELKNKVNYYRNKYYNENISEITDKEYDELFDQLTQMESELSRADIDSATQSVGYEVKSKLEKVSHNHPLLSLAKTKNINDIKEYFVNQSIMVSAKMDGLTVSLRYVDGKLVSAETRGDGVIGENILHNVKTFTNIPLTLPIKDEIIIDGEAIIDYDTFTKFEQEGYKNPRNLVSGSVRQLDSSICASRKVKFIAWKLYRGQGYENTYTRAFDYLTFLGFEVVPHKMVPFKEFDTLQNIFDNLHEITINKKYPLDGLVVCYDDAIYGDSLGIVGNHPKYGMAYKFYNDEVETILRDIEWTTSRTGSVNPVAIFDEVELYGTSVSRASLSNLSIVEELELGIGDTILVTKANEIIPMVTDNITRSNTFIAPTHCPSCGSELTVRNLNGRKTLMCTNDDCFAKLHEMISFFASKKCLDIEGLSGETIKTLMERHLITCRADIFKLKDREKEMLAIERFGQTKIKNLLSAVEKSKNTTFEKFITSLGIPNIGTQTTKIIFDFLNSRSNTTDIVHDFLTLADGLFNWSQLDGIGEKTEGDINLYVNRHFEEMITLANILHFDYATPEIHTVSSISGKTFCITGKLIYFANRSALVSDIESKGGKVVGGVTKSTDYLITNDTTSGSSKNKAAEKHGTKIISEEDYKRLN